jgi:hypothetical protein
LRDKTEYLHISVLSANSELLDKDVCFGS